MGRFARVVRHAGVAIAATAIVSLIMTDLVPSPANAAPTCTILGTESDDTLLGTDGDDVICGGNGNDRIFGSGGSDTLIGGNGNDVLTGGAGADALEGENGDDAISGEDGNDTIRGGNGFDTIDGGSGDDSIDGGADADTLLGGEGADVVAGDYGSDTVDGGPGDDRLVGGPDPDVIFGGAGGDTVDAGTGDDQVYGGPGDDVIDGGKDRNACDGGAGSNKYRNCGTPVETGRDQADVVWPDTDSDGAADVIELRAGSDARNADTDGDTIDDGSELWSATDPTRADTDGDGTRDDAEDVDQDGLTAGEELALKTNALRADTDGDALTDGDEVSRGTDPLVADSDGDGLSDGEESALNVNPLVADSDSDGTRDGDETYSKDYALNATGVTFTASGPGRAVLQVQLSSPADDRLHDVPGQRAPPVAVDAPLALSDSTLRIPFDASAMAADAEIAVLHFDESTGTFDIPADQHIDLATGVATVTTDDFSPFIVTDVSQFRAIWADEITIPREGNGAGQNIDVVLTLDSSGSMSWNDPTGLRKTAAKSFVDALLAGDKAAVVDFDSTASVYQSLTTDFAAAKAAIDRIDDNGGTSLSAGMNAALNELDAHGTADSQRVIVFLTDGDGDYSSTYTARAKDSGTVVYTVGLSGASNAPLLDSIASQTDGRFYLVRTAADLPETFDRIGGDLGAPDSDGDGLADETETKGWRDGAGQVYRTDPTKADTDGDGLSDGDEANELLRGGSFGTGTYFNAFSNPLKADTDGDGLTDAAELGHGTWAWGGDVDRDGLTDAEEVERQSTEPFNADTDVDGKNDPYEIEHIADRDPLLFERDILWYEYVGDFSRGALCGDITGAGGFCEATTDAFVWGVVIGGFIPLIDIRDLIANSATGDVVAAGLSLAGLIPLAGDAASALVKLSKAASRAPAAVAGSIVRSVMKAADRTPAEKVKYLADAGAARAVSRLHTSGIDDATIARLAARLISPAHFDEMIAGATAVNKGGEFYTLEKGAEIFLRARTPGALPSQILTHVPTDGGGEVRRFYDVLTDIGLGIEVKHGRAYGIGRAGSQLSKDLAILDNSQSVTRVEWHFFPNANGTIGPDQALLDLLKKSPEIPYVIWVQ